MHTANQYTRILYLLPSTLGGSDIHMVLPAKVIDIIHSLKHFVVEDERTARRFLMATGYPGPISSVHFYILNEHTEIKNIPALFKLSGDSHLGLLSEAGVPAVADPGAELVKEAHRKDIRVIPLVGPSSILLAIMASGLNGQNFIFNGYLPVKEAERIKRIKYLEKRSSRENQAQVFIETPYRNNRLINALLNHCHPDSMLCIASNLTQETEWIKTTRIREWKLNPPDLNRRPAVFVLQS